MNVLYLWDADYPWDVRVEKICESLAAHGHVVHIAARNLARRPDYERLRDLHIHRLSPRGGNRLNYALSFPAFFNPFWTRLINRVIRDQCIDLVIVRDLPMSIAGIRAARRQGIPVVFDMAEDYVSMVWNVWRHRRIRPLNLLVRNPYLAKAVERYALPRVDHTLVVIEEALDVVRRGGGALERTTIVSNTPRLEELGHIPSLGGELITRMRQRFSIVYAGGIRLERGLMLVLEALERVVTEIPDVLFVAIGSGNALAQLEQATRNKGLQEHVVWLGWAEHGEMLGYIRAARVAIIPNVVSGHTNTTIPNKIFDYMALGVPVVASNAIPMKRIVDETGCGLTFQSGDPADLARALTSVRACSIDYGSNGARAVRDKYHWGVDEQRLLGVVERLGTAAS